MTPDDIDWPPPVCDPCKDGQHLDCQPVPWCECQFGQCPPIPPDPIPTPREGQ